MSKKLSPHACELLILISDICDGTRYFVPPAGNKTSWSSTLGRSVFVDGSPSSSALNALQRRGLIKFKPIADYAAEITEDGKLLVEEWREKGWPVQITQKIYACEFCFCHPCECQTGEEYED